MNQTGNDVWKCTSNRERAEVPQKVKIKMKDFICVIYVLLSWRWSFPDVHDGFVLLHFSFKHDWFFFYPDFWGYSLFGLFREGKGGGERGRQWERYPSHRRKAFIPKSPVTRTKFLLKMMKNKIMFNSAKNSFEHKKIIYKLWKEAFSLGERNIKKL